MVEIEKIVWMKWCRIVNMGVFLNRKKYNEWRDNCGLDRYCFISISDGWILLIVFYFININDGCYGI